jgi:nicotinamidase-related amidase
MASALHETHLASLFIWHGIDTVIVTGGSTSGCVRATVVDSLSRGYRTIVPEECVADLHESPHFANLYAKPGPTTCRPRTSSGTCALPPGA